MANERIDPFDVQALEKSVNDSATRVSTIWVSFLIFGLYLVIAAGTVTPPQLFLEDPVKLPVLNIDLPLVGFFFLAPFLFVVFHAYVLIQVLLLGRTAAEYNAALDRAVKPPPSNVAMRQRLANTLFAQIFAGSPRERNGWLGCLLKLMAWLTLAFAPVLILLVFQFKFLPYHSEPVIFAIRILIVIDLLIVLIVWPAARNPDRDITFRGVVRQQIAVPVAIVTAAFAWIVLSFPGEPHAEWTRYAEPNFFQEFGGDLKCRTKSPISWIFSSFDRLDLRRVDVVDDEKLEKIKEHTKATGEPDHRGERTRSLRKRDFNCANLEYADLRRVDFAEASLRSARFIRSKLQGASFEHAQLQGASLEHAQLQGASFEHAQLQGASFEHAQLQGAYFGHAQLQGAFLGSAELPGAILDYAQLQGANLAFAKLQRASLFNTKLLGASLRYAELQGASLRYAELQGADLERTNLAGTGVFNSAVWRARNVNCGGARVQESIYDSKISLNSGSIEATPSIIATLIARWVIGITDLVIKQSAINQMHDGLVINPAKDDTAEIEKVWRKCEEASANVDKGNAVFLLALVCDATESQAAIVKGIVNNWISDDKDRRGFSARLARGLLGKGGKPCAATEHLEEGDRKRLRAAVSHTPSPAAARSP